jgi:cystathionine gamma-synthase
MTRDDRQDPRTIAAQALHEIDEKTGSIAPPLFPATTYARDPDYALRGATSYSRYGSPNVEHAERVLAALDGGAAALAFGAGMGAIVALFETVPSGRHVVAPSVMYHGTRDWLNRLEARRGIPVSWFDPAERDGLGAAIRPGKTEVVWVETPVNPTWDVIDIAHAADLAHRAGAILAVDSTAAPPVTTLPLALGADLVFHAATKYLNGHSDVLAGVLVTRALDERWAELRLVRNLMGTVLAPFEAWLLVRGLRTLYLRYAEASANALAIARRFERHPKVERVLYPGLAGRPGHAVARRQMTGGFGGMLSILVRGGTAEARRVCTHLKVFLPATSLGGVESLAEHRRSVEGPESPVPDNLIRLSIGIEAVADLIADLDQALATI